MFLMIFLYKNMKLFTVAKKKNRMKNSCCFFEEKTHKDWGNMNQEKINMFEKCSNMLRFKWVGVIYCLQSSMKTIISEWRTERKSRISRKVKYTSISEITISKNIQYYTKSCVKLSTNQDHCQDQWRLTLPLIQCSLMQLL